MPPQSQGAQPLTDRRVVIVDRAHRSAVLPKMAAVLERHQSCHSTGHGSAAVRSWPGRHLLRDAEFNYRLIGEH